MDCCNIGDFNVVKKITEKRADVLEKRSLRDFHYQLVSTGNPSKVPEKPQTYIEMIEEGFKEGIRIIFGGKQIWNEKKEAVKQFIENYQSVRGAYDRLYCALVNYQECQKVLRSPHASIEKLCQVYNFLPQLQEAVKGLSSNELLSQDTHKDIKTFLNEKITKMSNAKAVMEKFKKDKKIGPYSQTTLVRMGELQGSVETFHKRLEVSGLLDNSKLLSPETVEERFNELSGRIVEKVKSKLVQDREQFNQHYESIERIYNNTKKPVELCCNYDNWLWEIDERPRKIDESGNIKKAEVNEAELEKHKTELEKHKAEVNEAKFKKYQDTRKSLKQVRRLASDKRFSKEPFKQYVERRDFEVIRLGEEITKAGLWLKKLGKLDNNSQEAVKDMNSRSEKVKSWLSDIKSYDENYCGNWKMLEENLENIKKDIKKDKKVLKEIFPKICENIEGMIKNTSLDNALKNAGKNPELVKEKYNGIKKRFKGTEDKNKKDETIDNENTEDKISDNEVIDALEEIEKMMEEALENYKNNSSPNQS